MCPIGRMLVFYVKSLGGSVMMCKMIHTGRKVSLTKVTPMGSAATMFTPYQQPCVLNLRADAVAGTAVWVNYCSFPPLTDWRSCYSGATEELAVSQRSCVAVSLPSWCFFGLCECTQSLMVFGAGGAKVMWGSVWSLSPDLWRQLRPAIALSARYWLSLTSSDTFVHQTRFTDMYVVAEAGPGNVWYVVFL